MPDADATPGLDPAAVRRWLAGQGIDLSGDVHPHLFPGGRSNVTYRLTDDAGTSVVIRRPPLRNVLPTAHDMEREHRVLSGLQAAGYPAPRPLALCTDDGVTGAPFLVMEYVPGQIVATADDAALLTPAQRGRVSGSLVDALVRLHAVDVDAAGLTDLGRPDGYLPRQLSRWSRQWELTRTRDLPTMDRLGEVLARRLESLPSDLPWSLVHGDYRLDNVILDADSLDARAVLDWEMSTLGDPLADLALALVYWSEAGDHLRHRIPVAQHLTDGDGFWTRAEQIDTCTALACFKLAVITESIHARTLQGKQLGTAAGDVHAMGVATESLADLGLRVAADGTVPGLAS
jgi:aminoglycoside phosphotransferase (APT) family kinase protein